MLRAPLRRWFAALLQERLLLMFGLLALVLGVVDPRPWSHYRVWLDLPTLLGLVALLVSIEAIRSSGYVQQAAQALTRRMQSLRGLALLLVSAAAMLSMLLTNDVSLFLIVPLTVALGLEAEIPVLRLVIFEALAVNAGSTLSPIGNPQNLLLWQRSGVSMVAFLAAMAPAFLVMTALLLALTWLAFPARALRRDEGGATPAPESARDPAPKRPWLGTLAGLLLAATVVLLQQGRAALACGVVLAVFMLADRNVLKRVDWLLLATFAAMFLGLGHLAQWPPVQALLQALDWKQAWVMFLGGTLLSQFISNVPTAVLLSHYTTDYTALAVAVNVGGFGLGIGSLANLIALRLEGSRGALAAFHRTSVPFLLVCAPLVWLAQHAMA